MKNSINKIDLRQKIRMYKKRPKSLLLALIVLLCAAVCCAVIVFLIGYILVKGIPNLTPSLFAWQYIR